MKIIWIFFLFITSLLACQVQSGVIIEKIKNGLQGVKCGIHKVVLKVHSHEHQVDPCEKEEEIEINGHQSVTENNEVLGRSPTIPVIDIRSSEDTQEEFFKPKPRRISHVKLNVCPAGSVADKNGICREEY